MRILRPLLPLVCLLAATVAAGKPRLVPIANATIVAPKSSNPGIPLKVGSQIFFTANDGIHGNELWRSDGTAAGTSLVIDIGFGIAGSDPAIVGALGNDVLFRTWDSWPAGGLWRSNGTTAGTVKIFTFPQPEPSNGGGYYVTVIPADTKAYIVVQQNYSKPNDLWVTDGTAAGTQRVGAFGLSGSSAFGANGKLYFPASDDTVGTQFWVSDGTLLGTHMIQRSKECPAFTACGPVPTSLFRIGAQVYFGTATDGLWKTDGTPQGTAKVMQLANPYLYAGSTTVAYLNSGDTIWKTDGTAAGTTSTETVVDYVTDARVLDDGRLLYIRYNLGWEVWRSDGTPGGTLKILTLPVGSSNQAGVAPIVGAIGKRLFLSGWTAAAGAELWLGDADTGSASLLKDLDTRVTTTGPVSSLPAYGVELGGKMLFSASDLRGRELWESDGTAAGTKILANIADEPGGGFVSGTVRAAGTAAPIAGAAVRLCTPYTCESPTVTDANGAYRFEGVIPGSYTLSAIRTGYVSQLYGGVQCPCPTLDGGTRITVTSGFETAGIDFAMNPGGTISGTVTRLSDGTPVGAEVLILDQDFYVVQRTFSSGTTGVYRSTGSLATGTYYVEARPSSSAGAVTVVPQRFRGVNCPFYGCEGAGGEAVSVTAGSETGGVNFPLDVYGSISGTVRDASNGAAVPGVQVDFTRADPEYPGLYYPGATVKTGADGRYQSPLLNPGAYHVGASDQGFPLTFYPNQVCSPSCTPAATVTVSVNTNTTGTDFSLAPQRGRITGILRDSTGAPFPNVRVLLKPTAEREDYSYGDSTTDAAGRYLFGDVPAGSYHLFAIDELYPNVDCSDFNYCNRAGATAVAVTEGQTTTLDFPLRSRPVTITGRLLDAVTGALIPAGEASFGLYDQNQQQIQVSYGSTIVAGGNYSVTAITRKTSFFLTASTGGYRLTAYPAARVICPEYTTCPLPAEATLISTAALTGRDVRLARYGTISGTVYDARTGSPLRGTTVQFSPTTAGRPAGYGYTDDAGHYRWDRADGAYYAYTNDAPGMLGQVYPDRNCSGTCVPTTGNIVNAPEGVDVTGIDFHLQESTPTGKISGRVVDAVTGAGVANAYVQAYGTPSTSRSANTRTDAQGYYTLENASYYAGLASGDYTIYVEAGGAWYVALSGGTHCPGLYSCNLTGGTPVTVTAPNTTTGVNFQLIRLTLTSVSPAEGTISGGTSIAITGANFTPQSTVQVGGRAATIVSITPTRIVALTPVGLEGPAHVTVTLSPNLYSSLAHAYTYTPFPYTDPTLAALTRLKRAHVEELRTALKSLRTAASLPAFTYTDPSLAGKRVLAIHLLELRTSLDEARLALGRSKLTYTNTLTPGATRIRAIDVLEIRNGMH